MDYKILEAIWFVYNSMSIQLNNSETLSFSEDPADNRFQFTTALKSGDTYEVKVSSQPSGETCEVVNGKGTIDTADVTNVAIYCYVNKDNYEPDDDTSMLSTTYDPNPSGTNPINTQNRSIHDVDGDLDSSTNVTAQEDSDFVRIQFATEGVYTISVTNVGFDLDPVLVMYDTSFNELQYVDDDIEGGDEFFTISVDGTTYSTGTTYYLWVAPYWGSGFYDLTATLDGALYSLSLNVSGITGTAIFYNSTDGQYLSVSSAGIASFSKKIQDGSTYNITVISQPAGQTCSITSGSGTISGSNVTLSVSCTANGGTNYSLGGTVSGLVGSGLVLSDGAPTPQTKAISSNGWYSFNNLLASGTTYSVSVSTQPTNPSQTCTVSASGTITADVSTADVTCTTNTYTIGGTVSGLSGTVTLLNNGGDTLNVSSNGSFTFSPALNDGSNYEVTIATQPSGIIWKAKTKYTGSLNMSFTQPANVMVSVVISPN